MASQPGRGSLWPAESGGAQKLVGKQVASRHPSGMSAGRVVSCKPCQAAATGAQRLHVDSGYGTVPSDREAAALSLMWANTLADAHPSKRARSLWGPSSMCVSSNQTQCKKNAVLELQLTCQRGSSSKSSLTWEKRMLRVMALLSSNMLSKSCSSNCRVRSSYAAGQERSDSIPGTRVDSCASSSIAASHIRESDRPLRGHTTSRSLHLAHKCPNTISQARCRHSNTALPTPKHLPDCMTSHGVTGHPASASSPSTHVVRGAREGAAGSIAANPTT